MMEDEMGVVQKENGTLDFSKAKTLALYCNGYWCGQTPGMVKNAKFSLLKMGYPVEKIKYYSVITSYSIHYTKLYDPNGQICKVSLYYF